MANSRIVEFYVDGDATVPEWIRQRIGKMYGALDDNDYIIVVRVSPSREWRDDFHFLMDIFREKMVLALEPENDTDQVVYLVNHA